MYQLSPQRILVIYSLVGSIDNARLTIKDHLFVLEHGNIEHDITYFNTLDVEEEHPWTLDYDDIPTDKPNQLKNKEFDVIILHYTFLGYRTMGWRYPKWKKRYDWISQLDDLKIAIVQDEFSQPSIVDECLFDWDVDVIFSTQYEQSDNALYPIMRNKVEIIQCLPGYINTDVARNLTKTPIKDRKVDIAYRARKLSYWYGKHGLLKYKVADAVKGEALRQNLVCDISTNPEDTVLGSNWLSFLSSTKTTIGVEGGSNVLDWRGEIRTQITDILSDNPNANFGEVSKQLPNGWDGYKLYTITPRHLEAITVKTAQILIEGSYRHILHPNKHYIPLKRDFSNVDDCIRKVKDVDYLQGLVDCAYNDIFESGLYSYATFANMINETIARHLNKEDRKMSSDKSPEVMKIEVLERDLIRRNREQSLKYHEDNFQFRRLIKRASLIFGVTIAVSLGINFILLLVIVFLLIR